jgi:uncharacterized protein YjbJ (UPF0337 family)
MHAISLRAMGTAVAQGRLGSTNIDRATEAREPRRHSMNWNQIEGNWEQFKGKAQQQWGKLTNDDLDVVKGNRKELAGRIQERYGKTQEEAEREIDDWAANH